VQASLHGALAGSGLFVVTSGPVLPTDRISYPAHSLQNLVYSLFEDFSPDRDLWRAIAS